MFKRFLPLLVLFACGTSLIGMSDSYIELIDNDERTEETLERAPRITKEEALTYLATNVRELLTDEHINTITHNIISLLTTHVEPYQKTVIIDGHHASISSLNITVDPEGLIMVQNLFGMSPQEATECIEKLVSTLYGILYIVVED